jgi:hypothetical protein
MDKPTKQDFTFAAHALRVAAGVSQKQAEDPACFSSRDIYSSAAKSQRELAEKFERLAKLTP